MAKNTRGQGQPRRGRTPRRNPSRGFRTLLMRTLAELGRLQRRLAVRAGLAIPAVNKIVNKRRFPSELQVLRMIAGLVCTDEELVMFERLDETDTVHLTLAKIIKDSRLAVECIAVETSIGLRTIRRFLAKELVPSEEELVRIFLAVTVRDAARRTTVNDFLESVGDYLLGPTA